MSATVAIASPSGGKDSSREKLLREFEQYYLKNAPLLTDAVQAITHILRSALDEMKEELSVHDVSGRVKALDSCLQKYIEKYEHKNEEGGPVKGIHELLTDLVGIRIVCLYEDDITKIADKVGQIFEVIGATNKIEVDE